MGQNRIPIVEDDPAVARSLQIALQREGYTVLAATSGADALQLARSASPSLMLLDLRLPDISGFDVCRRLRAEGLRLPILMLTARDEEADKVVGLELGADDYVVKPYGMRELLSRIRALLRRAYGELADQTGSPRLIVGPLEMDLDRMQLRIEGRLIELTPIEFRLLRFLAANPDHAFEVELGSHPEDPERAFLGVQFGVIHEIEWEGPEGEKASMIHGFIRKLHLRHGAAEGFEDFVMVDCSDETAAEGDELLAAVPCDEAIEKRLRIRLGPDDALLDLGSPNEYIESIEVQPASEQ